MLDFNKETWVILTFRMVTILVEVWLLYKIRLLLWNHGVAFHSWVMAPVHKATIPLKKNHLQKKKVYLQWKSYLHKLLGTSAMEGTDENNCRSISGRELQDFLFQSPAGLSQTTDEPQLCLASPWKHIRTSGQPLPVLLHLPWEKFLLWIFPRHLLWLLPLVCRWVALSLPYNPCCSPSYRKVRDDTERNPPRHSIPKNSVVQLKNFEELTLFSTHSCERLSFLSWLFPMPQATLKHIIKPSPWTIRVSQFNINKTRTGSKWFPPAQQKQY